MTRLEIQELSQHLTDLYIGMETDLLHNIAEYAGMGSLDIPTAQWKIQKLAELGGLNKRNIKLIEEYAGMMPGMMDITVNKSVQAAVDAMEPGFAALVKRGIAKPAASGEVADSVSRAVKSCVKQAKSSLNIVNTLMGIKAKDAAGKLINDIAAKQSAIDKINKAALRVVTNAETRQQAVRDCLKELARDGLPAFVDKAGRAWTPEAYVNMCVRTTSARVAREARWADMEAHGLNLIEVSSHVGARPLCAVDQGKIYDLNNGSGTVKDVYGNDVPYYPFSQTSYGKAAGLFGINCGHFDTPFAPGVSLQRYFPVDDTENVEQYRTVQRQRELERKQRALKRERDMLKAVGDKKGVAEAGTKLKTAKAKYETYCAEHGLKVRPDRVSVPGYLTAAKADLAEFKGTGGITEITDKAIDRVPRLSIPGYSDKQLDYIQTQHKELLTYARDRNYSKEVAFVFSADFSERLIEIGTADAVEFSGNRLLNSGVSVVVVHNHPGNSGFSLDDLHEFLLIDSIKTLTVVKNNGSAEALTQLANYDKIKLIQELQRAVNKKVKTGTEAEYRKVINEFLAKLNERGDIGWATHTR